MTADDAAPTPPEVLREHVQAAAAEAVRNMPADWWCPKRSNTTRISCEHCIAEVAADAALAVFRGQQDPERQFAEWVVSLDDDDPESPGRQERRTVTLSQIVDCARAAIGGDGR